jgi:phage terminase large subunit GpA-like protein
MKLARPRSRGAASDALIAFVAQARPRPLRGRRATTSGRRTLHSFVDRARAPQLRSMLEFATREIILPDGPHQGSRYDTDRQPYARHYLDAVDSGQWSRFAAVGPTQSGKTLTCSTIPCLYHLFEIGETVIYAVPSIDIAKDKWLGDLLPVIEASRYRTLMPRRGGGAKGSWAPALRFTNGAVLRFMTGGGQDKARAAFTSRVLVVSEADGFDERGTTSREADKFRQLEARTLAYGDRARVYLECTASIEEGRIWSEYTNGTRSRLMTPCPHCRQYTLPGRDDLHGWQDAADEVEAGELANWQCPECDGEITDEQRLEANHRAVLVHEGQEAKRGGRIVGPMPRVRTLGFRWSAWHNAFVVASALGRAEWQAKRATDEENAEREMLQFRWALPHKPDVQGLDDLKLDTVLDRITAPDRGLVPPGTAFMTVGVDVGKYMLHWAAIAWRSNLLAHVVDYGVHEVQSRLLGVEPAIMVALRTLRDDVFGWPDEHGELIRPEIVCVDARWQGAANGVYPVYDITEESGDAWHPCLGMDSDEAGKYRAPTKRTTQVTRIGEGYHFSRLRAPRVQVVAVDANHWKSFLHARLIAQSGTAGAMSIGEQQRSAHIAYAKQLTAEVQKTRFDPKRGEVVFWERVHRQNHWLDATALACVAGHIAGWRVVPDTRRLERGRARNGQRWGSQKTSWGAKTRRSAR